MAEVMYSSVPRTAAILPCLFTALSACHLEFFKTRFTLNYCKSLFTILMVAQQQ